MTKTTFFLDPSMSDAELLNELRRIAPEHWTDSTPSTENPSETEVEPEPDQSRIPPSRSHP